MPADCNECWYNEYDEEQDEYFCSLYLDEDEYGSIMGEYSGKCKYFRPFGDEYDIVRKQN